jgi:ATP-binding cassette subfamily F protein uup
MVAGSYTAARAEFVEATAGVEAMVSALLAGALGSELFDVPTGTLSGGQRKMVGLARVLVTHPGIRLLDEPDNHLDLASKVRLERVISRHFGAAVIISHDRYFLDRVVDRVVELGEFPGGYAHYHEQKTAMDESA